MWKFVVLVAVLAVGAQARYTNSNANAVHEKVVEFCRKYNAEDKADEVEPGVWEFAGCFNTVMDPQQAAHELQEAIPDGTQAIKVVTKKYCAKSPRMKTCLHTLVTKLSPCMPNEIKENITIINNILDSSIDFACYDDGDRIARFIGEGGAQCFSMQAESLNRCQASMTTAAAAAGQPLSDQAQCNLYDEYKSCVERTLGECRTTVAKEIASSALAGIRKHLPCN